MKAKRHAMTWLNVALLALALFASAADAAISPDVWHNEISGVRALAENDARQAYLKARLLQQEIPVGAPPEDQARVLNLLARIELYLGTIDKAAQHSAEAREIAKKDNNRIGQIEANLVVAASAINIGRLDDMVDATRDNMNLLVGLEREDLRAEVMFHVAMMYLRFGQIDEAATVAMQSLDIARNNGNPLSLAYSDQAIATVYVQSGRYAEAREHYQSMREAARQAHSTLLEAAATLGLSSVATHFGNFAEGERQNQEAIALFRRVGAELYVAHATFLLADHYFANKQSAKALPLLDENVAIYEKHENPIGLWWTLNKRSNVLQALGRLQAARNDAERANELAKKIGYTVYLAGSARRLADMTAAQGDFERAYRLSAEAAELAGKLEQEKASKRILELAQRFQEESKQRKIDELNRNNELQHAQQDQLLIVLAATILLLGVTAVFVLRLRKSRAEIRALNADLEQRVLERTTELLESRQSLAEAQRIAHIGSWEMNLVDNVLTWSDEIYRIFEIDPGEFGASYEAFMETVHPDDRRLVDTAYKASLDNRVPFELEHRLQLPDGRIKFVLESCETIYAADGKPLRSIGTVQDITERKEMENALRESRQLMAEAQRIAQVGSWEYDIASDTHTWSDELYRIYEIDPAEGASYDGCMNTTHPDDREAVANAYLRAVETGQPYESEHRLLMKDGRIKYVHERSETVCGPDGTLQRAVGMMQDITERKQVEKKLKEALEFSEGVINAIPDILFEMGRDGRYLNVWTQHPELLAAQRKALLGKTVHDVLSPENAEASMEAIREADEKGYAQGADICIELPQGKRWFSHTLSKKPGGASGEATFLALSRDITERKQLEEALAARGQEFRSLAESSPDFIVRYDREGRHRYLNSNLMRKLGLSSMEDVLGKRPGEVWTDGRFSGIEKAATWAVESGQMQELEMSAPDEKGGVRSTQISVVPERDTSGNIIGSIAFGRDITAIREAERKLSHFIDNLPGMAYTFRMSPDGKLSYTYLSQAADEFYGMTIDQVMADFESTYSLVPEEDRERIGAAIMESARDMCPKIFEFRIRRQGMPERWLESRSLPERQTDGSILWYGIMLDITERKRIEAALQESEARYRYHYNQLQSMLESAASVSVFALDREYRYLFFNNRHREGAKRLRGTDIEIGMNMVETMPDPEFREFCRQGFDRVLAGNIVSVESKEKVVKDGVTSYEYNDNYGSPIFNDQGEVIGLTVFAINTTERKQMEAALQESELLARSRSNLLRAILESSPQVIVFALDAGYRYQAYNSGHRETMRTIWGKEIEAGMNMLDVISIPSDRETAQRAFDRALSGESFVEESAYGDETLKREYWQTYYSPIRSESGEITGLTCFVLNISARKRLEAELRESHNFLNSVIDAVPDPIFVKDRQHRWALLNDAFCTFIGHARETLLDKSDYDFFPQEQADVFWQKDELVFDSGEVNLNEENFTSADGVTHFIQTKKTPFVSADGRQMLVGVIRDISDRKQFEAAREAALAEAERLAKQRSDFLSHMSHELRTPLNSILGYAQLLQRDKTLDGRNADAIQTIRQGGEHLLSLIDDILDLARIDAGRFELEIDFITLPVFFEVLCNIIEVRAQDKGIGFECVLSPDLPACVRGDERRLRQVLLNLLSNAIKFTDSGKVALRVRRRDTARLLFEVEDTGVGIAENELEAIFRPFEQAGDVSRRSGGSGLGLSISRQLVRLMGGEISVESRMGKGSLFRFELELQPCGAGGRPENVPVIQTAEADRLPAEPMAVPPRDEILALRELALLGNMRDILEYAGRIEGLDSRYRRFAEHLRELAAGYQSKAILQLAERYLQ